MPFIFALFVQRVCCRRVHNHIVPSAARRTFKKRAITSVSIACAKLIYLHRLQPNIVRVQAEVPASYQRILHSLCARSCVCFLPFDVRTFLPTQSSRKSRPKLFHPIIALPQPSSSYSPLPFPLHHSNIISSTIHPYGHTICHHTCLPLPSFTTRIFRSSVGSAILCHLISRRLRMAKCSMPLDTLFLLYLVVTRLLLLRRQMSEQEIKCEEQDWRRLSKNRLLSTSTTDPL